MKPFLLRPVRLLLVILCLLLEAGGPVAAQGDAPDARWSLRPAEGLWSRPGAGGTAVHLARRGELFAVGLYDFVDGQPRWRIGTGQMQGDTLRANLLVFADGSCIDCAPARPPRVEGTALALTLRFASARRAWLRLDDGPELPLQAFAFGSVYADVGVSDALDASFGTLPVPQLCGLWAFEPNPQNLQLAEFSRPLRSDRLRVGIIGRDRGRTGELYELRCQDNAPEGCEFIWTHPSPPAPAGRVAPGDIEENRIRFVMAGGAVVYAHRLGEVPEDCRAP